MNYEKILQEQIEELKCTEKSIVLFGTLDMATYAKKTLSFLNRRAVCFCDNNQDKWGKSIEDIKILSPENVKSEYPDAKIYICSFNRNNIRNITRQLFDMGFNDINNSDMLFFVYQIYYMKRPVLPSALANMIKLLNNPRDKLIVGGLPGNLPVVITEKCNLNCRDCGVMMPYYKHPKHYNKDFIINSIKKLAECVDVIETLNIIGGETFLHPDLVEICEEAGKITNIFRIVLATNGTIIPNEIVLQEIKKTVTEVIISDYGQLSFKKNELIEVLKKKGISCTVFEDDVEWTEILPPKQHLRGKDENKHIFSNCKWVYFAPKIINGEFHLCDYSAAVAPFKVIPDNEEDFLNVFDESLSVEDKRNKVNKLLNQTNSLKVCDYCSFYKLIPAPRAVQIKGFLEF